MSLAPLPAQPKVSVFTLAYQQEDFVAEAIESVLAQDWPRDRFEYVVIDDGSTDGTAEAIRPYADRLRFLQQENQGIRAGVNRALPLLDGDLITGVAGDDVWLPNRLAALVEGFRRHPGAGLVYSDGELIDRDGAVLAPSFMRWADLAPADGRIRDRLLKRNLVSGAACMLRGCLKDVFHPIPPAAAWEDYWWAWAISGVADVVHVPDITYRYRYHGGNVTLGASGERLLKSWAEELAFRRFMLSAIAPGEASPSALLAGIDAMWALINKLPADTAALAPDESARTAVAGQLETAVDALGAGRVDEAALACARVAALSPHDPALIALVHELTSGRPATEREPGSPVWELDARAFVVLLDGTELLSAPGLLGAYASRFGADDDATLVIHATPGIAGPVAEAVPAALAAVGVDPDGGPDMALTTDPYGRLIALAAEADAVLGRDVLGSGLPAFALADVDSLHVLARHRWRVLGRSAPAADRPLR